MFEKESYRACSSDSQRTLVMRNRRKEGVHIIGYKPQLIGVNTIPQHFCSHDCINLTIYLKFS